MELQVVALLPMEQKKIRVVLDNGESFLLYKGEIRTLQLREGCMISEIQYEKLLYDILGKRATKRAMYLLQKQERTEKQLREKLTQGGYPKEAIEQAISYVKGYHYIDDKRYASTYIRYHQDKMSRQQLLTKLLTRGVSREIIAESLEEEYVADEKNQIYGYLKKRHFGEIGADEKEYRKTVQFLLRKGFKSNDIYKAMQSYTR